MICLLQLDIVHCYIILMLETDTASIFLYIFYNSDIWFPNSNILKSFNS